MKDQLIANWDMENFFFHFWFFRGKIDNPQIDPKMGNFHITGTMVIKRNICWTIWQVNVFEIYFRHFYFDLHFEKWILSFKKSSKPYFRLENPFFVPQIGPKCNMSSITATKLPEKDVNHILMDILHFGDNLSLFTCKNIRIIWR